ncbi:hypothetical protein, partial [Salmonella enterica]|uniref:hypothetical protein n=1 Tax=Salmonella enterica TaxID=28901 RepID=UPI003CF28DDD
FLDKLRMVLDRGQRIEISGQELHSFAPVTALADVVERAAESGIRNRTLHFGGLTKVSYHEFARAFARRFGYDPNLVLLQKSAGPAGA